MTLRRRGSIRTAALIVTTLMTPGLAAAQDWSLDWADEFDGSTLNTAKWTPVVNCGDRRNDEQQCYDADAISVDGGYLTITARRQSRGGFPFVSGAVKTGTTYAAQPPVRVEFRARLPQGGQGLWPALWMYPRDEWPPEIDVLEAVNDMHTVWQNYHWGTWPNHYDALSSTWVGHSETQFHTYAIEWQPTAIRWYVDGQLTKSQEGSHITSTPMQIYVNLALGGSWPGNVGGGTPFPQTLVVDWVRVYTPDGTLDPAPEAAPEPDPEPDPAPDPNPPAAPPVPPTGTVMLATGTVSSIEQQTTQQCQGWGRRQSCTTVALDRWTVTLTFGSQTTTVEVDSEPAIAVGDPVRIEVH